MNIKLVIFDFDGVFTDGKCYFNKVNNKSTVNKYYNIKDGMSLKILKDNNIISGLISSYSTDKLITLNEIEINEEITNHLKFDYKYIGKQNKINILDEWLIELGLTYKNVAYIGDDINDIEIMKQIGFSACPCDAIDKCKSIVDYICIKSGGNGCVREFVDMLLSMNCLNTELNTSNDDNNNNALNTSNDDNNNNNNNNILDGIKTEFAHQINNYNMNDVKMIANMINECKGTVHFMGVGKSGNIAKHCCDLLKCISINCYYLEITNLLHGDIGVIKENDVIIMFSKSGNTKELINIIPFCKEKKSIVIGICCDKNSAFKELCNIVVETPLKNEISGTIDKIPTNSVMSHLLFSNILVSLLKIHISLDLYKENHPSGNIGNNLKKIKDVMVIDNYPKIIIDEHNNENGVDMYDVLIKMTEKQIGCCFFVNKLGKLIGILTDGDIRRLISKNNNIQQITVNEINTDYYFENDVNKYVVDCKIKYTYIPIINETKIIFGILLNLVDN